MQTDPTDKELSEIYEQGRAHSHMRGLREVFRAGMAAAVPAEHDPLDHDHDGKKGGSLPKAKRKAK